MIITKTGIEALGYAYVGPLESDPKYLFFMKKSNLFGYLILLGWNYSTGHTYIDLVFDEELLEEENENIIQHRLYEGTPDSIKELGQILLTNLFVKA